jgi:hypothetical protein
MKAKKRKYFFLYKYWIALKLEYIKQRNERKFYSFLNKLPKRPEAKTEELTYPQCEIVDIRTNANPYVKTIGKGVNINVATLPIRKTKRIIRVTQISCKPLEFMPEEKYRY